ncbi:MAG: hypothetical protein HQK79_20395 [Desulfobacterales bacterium]|nr:hypothetical protein [Desulfobacterales bacterium]
MKYKIRGLQSDVTAYVDDYVVGSDGIVIYLALFGVTAAVKSLSAQIIERKMGVKILDETNKVLVKDLKKEYGSRLRMITQVVKSGVVYRILYSEKYFLPWKSKTSDEFLTYGQNEEASKERIFSILDKVTSVPLKKSWITWLYENVIETSEVNIGGQDFQNCKVITIPDEDSFAEKITSNLEILKQI